MGYRLYDIAGRDGYPDEWHRTIKHRVREEAGHRCVRCKHPYKCGEKRADRGEWSRCDEQCDHDGPVIIDGLMDALGMTWPEARGAGIVLARWRILTVHHLDGNKLNCRWWNLVALCQRCHLEIQGRVKLDRPWLLEHSEWFKPYVAGYYAWQRLGEDLTRAQVLERLDELLAIGGPIHV